MRKILLLILFISSILLEANAHSKYKIKKDTIPLRKTEKSLLIRIADENITWVSAAVTNKKLNLIYGSNNEKSQIYVTSSEHNFKNVNTDTLKNLRWFKSTYSSSINPVLNKGNDKFPLFIYSYNAPFKSYIYDKFMNINHSSKNISNYFVPENEIIKITGDNAGRTRAFYIDNRFDKGVIMSISSNDLGYTWNYPEICISDNLLSFKNGSMAMDRKGILYAILTDENNLAYLSRSENNGQTWSYPEALSRHLLGVGHNITINRSGVYILYRSLHQGHTFGDYIVWSGNINELNNGAHNGQKVVVMENVMARLHNVQKMKIEHFKGNKYILYGIMEENGVDIINAYLFKGRFYF